MDQDCVILTAEGDLKTGICCGEHPDFIRESRYSYFPGIKGFRIGYLPEDLLGKSILLYVEDEQIYRQVSRNWVE